MTSDGAKLRVGELELDEAAVRGLLERKSFEDGRRAQMPETADRYELSLPEDFKLPPGAPVGVSTPKTLPVPRCWARQRVGARAPISTSARCSGMLGLYASHQIAEAGRFAELQKVELGKLGANVSARVDAVNTWLSSQLPADQAKALRTSMFTSRAVEAYETLMHRHVSQGVSGSPGRLSRWWLAARGPP